jgi:hypothetical protein
MPPDHPLPLSREKWPIGIDSNPGHDSARLRWQYIEIFRTERVDRRRHRMDAPLSQRFRNEFVEREDQCVVFSDEWFKELQNLVVWFRRINVASPDPLRAGIAVHLE